MNTQDARIGMTVTFGRPNGEKTLAEVVKVNGKSLKVRTLEGRGSRDLVGQVWRVATALCTPADGSAAPVRPSAVPALTEDQLMHRIRSIYANLSPENLTCDGELSQSQVASRYRALRKQLKDCFRALGRTVDEGEAYYQQRIA